MTRWGPSSVRARLTLWYTLALAILLFGYSAGVHALLRRSLFAEIDGKLREDVEAAEEDLTDVLAGRSRLGATTADRDRWGMDLWEGNGRLAASPEVPPSVMGVPRPSCGDRVMSTHTAVLADGLAVRLACRTVVHGGRRLTLRAARSAAKLERDLAQLRFAMGLGLVTTLSCSAAVGYFLARRALDPVRQMTAKARDITADRLSERLPVENPDDELGQLATAFNETFARLGRSFEQMRRFSADASHELRTPLTVIRTTGEVALRQDREPGHYREVIASLLEETDRLRHLVESLLTLSRADAGQLRPDRKPIEIVGVVRGVTEHLSVLAEEKRQELRLEAEPALTAWIDVALIRQAVINLIDNAIRYGPSDSAIDIRLTSGQGKVVLEVTDRGPGIPGEHQERIFERFYRVDDARSRGVGGAGLGLSIVRWVVEAHGGAVGVSSNGKQGSTFRMELPIGAGAAR